MFEINVIVKGLKLDMKKYAFFFLLILPTFWSCHQTDRKFPDVKNLSEYEKTVFVPTLEHKITRQENAVYCATLLFAWDELRKQIGPSFTIGKEYADLLLLNQSKTYVDVLQKEEYSASIDVDGDNIRARAEFRKALPFEFKLAAFKNKLTFDNLPVASFGIMGNVHSGINSLEIVYYRNDNNFLIKLLPGNKNHEMLLLKSTQVFPSMAAMYQEIERLSILGKKEKSKEKHSWKYYLAADDEVVIPKFSFNIETNYKALEGNTFSNSKKEYVINTAWQRTAFVLDETGAEIESEADVFTTEAMEEEDIPKPKKIVFDKPFILFLKRTDAKNPYFGLWTTNTALMVKE